MTEVFKKRRKKKSFFNGKRSLVKKTNHYGVNYYGRKDNKRSG